MKWKTQKTVYSIWHVGFYQDNIGFYRDWQEPGLVLFQSRVFSAAAAPASPHTVFSSCSFHFHSFSAASSRTTPTICLTSHPTDCCRLTTISLPVLYTSTYNKLCVMFKMFTKVSEDVSDAQNGERLQAIAAWKIPHSSSTAGVAAPRMDINWKLPQRVYNPWAENPNICCYNDKNRRSAAVHIGRWLKPSIKFWSESILQS